jgi:hypothetical protein
MTGGLRTQHLRGTRLIIPLVVVSLAFCSSGYAGPIVLLDDTWDDGTRTDTNLPDESAVYYHPVPTPPATLPAVTTTVGNLKFDQTGLTASSRLWTYFTADASSPASIPVGKALRATIRFVPEGLFDTASRNFRFGLFRDPSPRSLIGDGVAGDGGPGADPNTNMEGYAVFMPITTGPTNAAPFQINKRDPSNGNSSLMGSSAAYDSTAPSSSSGALVNWVSGEEYTIKFLVHRVSSTQVNVTGAILQGNNLLSTHTVNDVDNGNGTSTFSWGANSVVSGRPPYTNFDLLYFRFSSASGSANMLNFKQFRVEIIPEPATLVLLALGGVALAAVRRRGG